VVTCSILSFDQLSFSLISTRDLSFVSFVQLSFDPLRYHGEKDVMWL
jgi:hypothetical protein